MNAGGTLDLDLPAPVRQIGTKDVASFIAYPILCELKTEIQTDLRNVKDAAAGDGAVLVEMCEAVVLRALARRGVGEAGATAAV